MSTYLCSITGEPAEVPVASRKTGHIYEKKNIEKYINANQPDPVTNQYITKDDLVSIQVNHTIKPRPTNTSGVSDLITIFQNEYDSLVLEAHMLRNNIENVRKELSDTLYQHDAAVRVIGRLIKERDQARRILEERENQMEEEKVEITEGLPEEYAERIKERKGELNKMRKEKRKNKELVKEFASQETLAGYNVTNSLTLHSTTKPGITCLDINLVQDDLLVTGGNDGAVIFYSRTQDKIINTYTKHHKKITDVKFAQFSNSEENMVYCLLSCEDGRGNLLANNLETGNLEVAYRVDVHRHPLVGCLVHPLNEVGIFACRDGTFSYHDLTQGRLVSHVSLEQGFNIKSMKVHPDGHIAIIGGHDGTVKLWDVLEHKQLIEFKAHRGGIDTLNFSENGVNFATGSNADKTVKLWDLRNLSGENFKIVDNNSGGAVNFDQFGNILAVGTHSLRLFDVKNLEEFARWDSHKDSITSIQFGTNSSFMATVSLDRYLTIYS